MSDPISTVPAMAPWVSDAARDHFARHVIGAVPPPGLLAVVRDHYDRINSARLEVALRAFPVSIERATLGGVPVAMVTPAERAVEDGPLLCLHGGAFMWGSGAGALLEAVPLAVTARRAVIAVDYRLAPEHLFPAAVDDVLHCYAALRGAWAPQAIGMFGCSAGGVLVAQALARLAAENAPLPGAVAMLHATGIEIGGDTLAVAPLLNGLVPDDLVPSLAALPFLVDTDPADPLVFPGEHPDMLARFPPSLLVSGTRDFAASSVATMHRRLLAAGVDAEFVLFDGMWHAHHVDTDLPEARETFELMARFFAKHLSSVS